LQPGRALFDRRVQEVTGQQTTEGISVRILPGEPYLILGRFRASLFYPLPFHRDRNSQHVKGLAIFRREFAGLPGAVREYEIQEFAFLRWRLTLEHGVRAVRQFQ
jgi:hypothetical protein